MFSDRENIVNPNEIPYDKIVKWCIGVDYGTGNATVFLLGGKDTDGNIYIVKEYYFAGREEARRENDYDVQKTDLEFAQKRIKPKRDCCESNSPVFGTLNLVETVRNP